MQIYAQAISMPSDRIKLVTMLTELSAAIIDCLQPQARPNGMASVVTGPTRHRHKVCRIGKSNGHRKKIAAAAHRHSA